MSDENQKIRATERLFDAIGEIDERLIKDAENAYVERRSPSKAFAFRKFTAAVAAMLVLTVGMLGGFIISGNRPIGDDAIVNDADSILSGRGTALGDLLFEAATTSTAELVAPEEIDFFDGNISIIWSYEGENDYYMLSFAGAADGQAVKNKMSSTTDTIDATMADSLGVKVWVSFGNGEVVSPYLKASGGNVGYRELFDYSAEVIPSGEFTDFVQNEIYN